MIIDRKLAKYTIYEEASVLDALREIEERSARILVVVSSKDRVRGVVTNGDIFRWLVKSDVPNLNLPIVDICNSDYKYVIENDDMSQIHRFLDDVLFVPILTSNNQLIAVAKRSDQDDIIEIDSFKIGKGHPCFIIAEIGNNHNGNIALAKKLVDRSIMAGANCVKFQLRNLKTLYANEGDGDDIRENLGSQYTLDLLSKFQLSNEELFEVFDYCKQRSVLPLCTPWDADSLNLLEKYGMPAYKVASADLTNHEFLKILSATGKPLICSTGMSSEEEIIQAESILKSLGTPHCLLHCNSTYPTPFSDVNLNYMDKLQEIVACPIGYSGHERGVSVSIAAVVKGASIIERHITLDKGMEGNDHKASLLPEEFKVMVQGIREVEQSLGSRDARKMTQGEMMNRVNLAKSLIINCDLKKGEVIEDRMVEIKSPGRGLQPNYRDEIVGLRAKRDFKKFDFFYSSDIEKEEISRKHYDFNRPYGIPVRYHDFKEMISGTNLNLIEFHLSYKDLDVDFNKFFVDDLDMNFVVHSPELFEGDHTLDLCSPIDEYRNKSIDHLNRVIKVTRGLKKYFLQAKKRTLIVTNVGGFTNEGFLSHDERLDRLKLLESSLDQLDTSGIEIIPQTMPPFPWHFGGQQYHNLFVMPDEIVDFCKKKGMRICLDTSHSKLACAHYKLSFRRFLELTLPYSAHLHIADAENTGGEGLQIGEGQIDFHSMGEQINRAGKDVSFIPEVWQGHENQGEGFWRALSKLEKYLN